MSRQRPDRLTPLLDQLDDPPAPVRSRLPRFNRPPAALLLLIALVALAALVALWLALTDSTDSNGIDQSLGTQQTPFAYDALVPIAFDSADGEDAAARAFIFNVRVSEPRDITIEVLDENPFNAAPPAGVRFVGFDVEMTLASSYRSPFVNGSQWMIVGGATGKTYKSSTLNLVGCGVVKDPYSTYSETFIGDTVSGTVCIPVPTEDLDNADTVVAVEFSSETSFFSIDGATPDPIDVGEQQISARRYDSATPARLTAIGREDLSTWNVTVGEPRDLTDTIDFPMPPEFGFRYVGFSVEMTLASAPTEPLAPNTSFDFGVIGGASGETFEPEIDSGCFLFSKSFVPFHEVFIGGTLRGDVCVAVPTADVEHPNTSVLVSFSGEQMVFTTDGLTPTPATIEPLGGPAAQGASHPLDDPIRLKLPVVGNTWSATVSNWRDMTDEVDTELFGVADGALLAGFEAELTLADAEVDVTTPLTDFRWEIFGGATNRVYDPATLSTVQRCGVFPDEFDMLSDITVGGVTTGTICISIPAEDFSHPDTRISMTFITTDPLTFDPGG